MKGLGFCPEGSRIHSSQLLKLDFLWGPYQQTYKLGQQFVDVRGTRTQVYPCFCLGPACLELCNGPLSRFDLGEAGVLNSC